ncbi:helix-turn-helix domain-containing protein [Alkalibaculum sp. M08DMB]|uniref:Helix-turn-helix domain-containing protein n=1 Tax=Alkalibaculum sporogenes TaxID=2655001 RepID=A0A6A7K4Z3_9FIRM|nr:helix-turn-helix transcriptional regulator [Alkalibaculum sporogenes]MPW24450.1 helix-turn-helix domain-containing protein [Alkalibaculum sporogenes]
MENNTALTAQDVADILKIAKNTVYELIKRGELNSYKVGRKVRFTMNDVQDYIENSKRIKPVKVESVVENILESPDLVATNRYNSSGFVICGQDIMLDVLSNYIEQNTKGGKALRAYIGSYNSLISLYRGDVQVASAHLWDGDTGQYNIPYVKRLLPGIPAVIIHLACRMQGFYVAKGNPKNILTWNDLKRSDITMINREKGAGSRVLVDEHLRILGVYGSEIDGYQREAQSHLTAASTVARGGADVAIGNENNARQVKDIDFIPLQKERYELVVRKEDTSLPQIQAIFKILRSDEFKLEFEGIGGYDIKEMGNIVAET